VGRRSGRPIGRILAVAAGDALLVGALLALVATTPLLIPGATAGAASAANRAAATDGAQIAGAIHYRLDPADPALLSAVQFSLADPAAVSVQVAFASDDPRWYLCAQDGSRLWNCAVSLPASSAATLHVRAND
jgi:hypothetical protein